MRGQQQPCFGRREGNASQTVVLNLLGGAG
jgi:hypothetical protein